jgi:hypothetical protein
MRRLPGSGPRRAATVVDHVMPHRGDQKLFGGKANWLRCCDSCYDAKTGREGCWGDSLWLAAGTRSVLARSSGSVRRLVVDKPARNDLHPTMKPVALMERAVRNSRKSRDIVLDPLGGWGST